MVCLIPIKLSQFLKHFLKINLIISQSRTYMCLVQYNPRNESPYNQYRPLVRLPENSKLPI